ncbi:hypothetical protein LIER_33989 [Lithospermum erythrorhizon]|uniref:Homeobox domain-containing protein n=1 Tax=Lithospermum erythrorhizon TaxID=34254 RepID=A0AAV3S3G2_LITER
MELDLSLGDGRPKGVGFLDRQEKMGSGKDEKLGFFMGLGRSRGGENGGKKEEILLRNTNENKGSLDPPLQLDLLPFSHVPRSQTPNSSFGFPWLSENLAGDVVAAEPVSTYRPMNEMELNRRLSRMEEVDEGGAISSLSPNSAVSSLHRDYTLHRNGRLMGKRDFERAIIMGHNNNNNDSEDRGGSSRGSDEEENGSGNSRKKLRLTKQQSAFLEESFKEHSTLNPKQKLALATQLNLRPRQVEVWFQNRRARTKLKQTEVDCEYLKRCCEVLTEENKRLQKELQELRALKASQPFYMQLPATTLTMCPSCERVVSTPNSGGATATTLPPLTTTTANGAPPSAGAPANTTLSLAKTNLFPFSPAQIQAQKTAS